MSVVRRARGLEVHVLDAVLIERLVKRASALHVLFSADTDVEHLHLFC